MESCRLYYNDTLFEASRLELALPEEFVLLEKLGQCHLKADVYEHHKLLKLLPRRLQPQMLSQITEEKVVETQIELCQRNCEFSGFFRKHLSSAEFRHGLICLIRAESEGKVTQEEAENMCRTAFGRIQIICCRSLQTELWLKKQPLPNTAAETGVYVKQERQGCIFYLQHSDMDHMNIFEVCGTLAREINHLLGTYLGHTTYWCVHSSSSPGTEIPEEWHDALDMNILNNFEEGEYVGYHSNGKYIYAVIVEELPGNSGQFTQRYKIDIGHEEAIEVSFLDLYQFKREKQPTISTCLELQLVEDATRDSSSLQSTRCSPASIEEAKKEIDKCLNEIWTLPKEERQKAIKRLYLRWHPDKNPDCSLIAAEAFKHLKYRIDELTNGKRKSTASTSTSFKSTGSTSTGSRSTGFTSSSSKATGSRSTGEAKRWCRQAQCDLSAAYNDVGKGSTEWCLFKVHQAVEKSLIAASYRNNGKQPNCSSISALASKVSSYSPQLSGLSQLVRDLIALDVDAKKTQYPTYHSFPNIPNGQFRSANERRALDKASEILTLVETYVNH
uniref:HEPN domain-containing protein n=1 Tax=Neogobius melanostomus TaxID=47308 RepID=A0A8C6S6T8_9GOBI